MYCSLETCQPTAKAGEWCGPDSTGTIHTYAECGPGLYCASSGLCTELASFGQPCDPLYVSALCDPSLRCDATTSKCANKLITGASCIRNTDCIYGSCSGGICQGPLTVAMSSLCSSGDQNMVPTSTADGGV